MFIIHTQKQKDIKIPTSYQKREQFLKKNVKNNFGISACNQQSNFQGKKQNYFGLSTCNQKKTILALSDTHLGRRIRYLF